MNKNIIGITGKKFNGKDTLGDYLVSNYNYKKISFADALKNICKILFNFTDEQLYGDKKEIIDEFWQCSPRRALQYIGTDLLRNQMDKLIPNIGEDIWITIVKRKIIEEQKINPNVKIVICDVRFSNEINMIKELNGLIIKVERDINTNIDKHISENSIDNSEVNFIFNNNKTKEFLYNQINILLQKIIKK